MTNLNTLEARYKELGEEIERLKKVEADKIWPKVYDLFWIIDRLGPQQFLWHDHETDNFLKSIGNIFRTKEDAEKQIEALKVIEELRRQPGRKMFRVKENNFKLKVDLTYRKVLVDYNRDWAEGFGQVYFESTGATEAAINTVGHERILAAARWLAMGE